MPSNTGSSTTTSALRGLKGYLMTWLGFKVQGVITRQTLGSWFWGGEITGWVSYQWACFPIFVLQASTRRRDSLEFRHRRDRRVLREVHDGCRRLAQPRRVVLGASYGESFPRCPSELFQACILKRARATTCGDKPASELGNAVFLVADSRIPNHTLYVANPNHTLYVANPNHTLYVPKGHREKIT